MEDRILKDIDFKKEIYVLVTLIFLCLLNIYLKEDMLTFYLIIASGILYLISIYINKNKLKVSRLIFNLFICLLNVISLAFVIQYLLDMSIEKNLASIILKSSIDNPYSIFYIIWILVFTSIIILIMNIGGRNYARK